MQGKSGADDFVRNPTYERRAVAFYDTLGWRDHIARAGNNEAKIGELRRLILRASRMLGAQQERVSPDIRHSTFSDNVVISVTPSSKAIVHLLGTLACFQIGSAAAGFLVRGGVTCQEVVSIAPIVIREAADRSVVDISSVKIGHDPSCYAPAGADTPGSFNRRQRMPSAGGLFRGKCASMAKASPSNTAVGCTSISSTQHG